MRDVTITVNGVAVEAELDERTLLLEFIRDVAGLTGTHNGCLEARCGCCSVEVDGAIVKSCNVLAVQVDGKSVTTIEGLAPQRLRPVEHITSQSLAGMYEPLEALGATESDLHPVQVAFHRRHALQCGFCTPAMLMTAVEFIRSHPGGGTSEEIREAISGVLCRCTGYQQIIEAIQAASQVVVAPAPEGASR